MFYVRPIAREDLPAVLALSERTGHGLTTLPADRERLAFVLRYAEGHELTEAAAALDVSLATVKRMLQRAEAHVQKRAKDDDLLSDWTGGDDE